MIKLTLLWAVMTAVSLPYLILALLADVRSPGAFQPMLYAWLLVYVPLSATTYIVHWRFSRRTLEEDRVREIMNS